ncbi:MAG: right-handed parallel beta-helix repeat-containing protein [Saprospiraceae bacterium]
MQTILLSTWTLRILICCSISFITSCEEGISNHKTEQINRKSIIHKTNYELCKETKDYSTFFTDTIAVQTAEELEGHIQSNRVIILSGKKYTFKSTLKIEDIKNLKIIGTDSSELIISNKITSVINLLKTQNIYFENLKIGSSVNSENITPQGIINIEHSSNINISNCKIFGLSGFGLTTNNVCHLKFENSEVTACTGMLFLLEQSQNIQFIKSRFHNNDLKVSVLGGFTNLTKEVTFIHCEFSNNISETIGNPAFNFDRNWENFEEKIIFSNCIFTNNKSYKWYGDKITLDNYKIDSSDFIGLQN